MKMVGLEKQPNDFYQLIRLDPSYQVLWEDLQLPLPANFTELKAVFESLEKGAGNQLELFLKEAAYKYEVGIHKFVEKPGLSITEFFTLDVAKSVFKIDLLTSIHTHVRKYFSNPKLIQIAEFPMQHPYGLAINDNRLYVAEAEFGVKMFSTTEKDRIADSLLASDKSLHAFDLIALKDKKQLLMTGNDGFYVYDISQADKLLRIGGIKAFGN
jgi:hypothetical protein